MAKIWRPSQIHRYYCVRLASDQVPEKQRSSIRGQTENSQAAVLTASGHNSVLSTFQTQTLTKLDAKQLLKAESWEWAVIAIIQGMQGQRLDSHSLWAYNKMCKVGKIGERLTVILEVSLPQELEFFQERIIPILFILSSLQSSIWFGQKQKLLCRARIPR